jgi:DHA1 family multidrug resistance protein-like MFS transporter
MRASRLMSESLVMSPLERRALLWMCVIIFVNQLGFGAIVPVLPLYAESFEVSVSAIGATVAIFGLSRMLAAVPSGRLADRLGRRHALALGGALSVAGNLWSAWASGFIEFLLARFVAGAGAGMVVTIGAVVLADISTPERRGRMMSLYQGCFLFAVGIGPLPGGLLAEHYGLAFPFLANAVAAALVGLISWGLIPETRGHGLSSQTRAEPALPFAQQIRLMMGKLGFMLVCLTGFMHAAVRTGGLFSIVPLLASSKLSLGAGQIGGAMAVGSVCGLLATYPSGMISDRYGRKPLIVVAALMTGVAFMGFWLASGYATFMTASIVWGVASAVTGAAPTAYAADSAPEGMNAAAISTYRALSDIGYVVGPIGLGLLADLAGATVALSVCAAGITLMALAFARWAPESYRGTRR